MKGEGIHAKTLETKPVFTCASTVNLLWLDINVYNKRVFFSWIYLMIAPMG